MVGGYNVLEFCRKYHVDRIIYTQTVFDVSSYPHDIVLKADAKPNFSYVGDHAVYVIAKNTMLELMEHYRQEYGLKNSSSDYLRSTLIVLIHIIIPMALRRNDLFIR